MTGLKSHYLLTSLDAGRESIPSVFLVTIEICKYVNAFHYRSKLQVDIVHVFQITVEYIHAV